MQFVTRVYVGDVQFYNWLLEDLHRVDYCNRRETVSRGIDDEGVGAFSARLNEFDDSALEVRLLEREIDVHLVRKFAALKFDRLQCRVSIDVRLADSQVIEIWTIYDHQSCCHRHLRRTDPAV